MKNTWIANIISTSLFMICEATVMILSMVIGATVAFAISIVGLVILSMLNGFCIAKFIEYNTIMARVMAFGKMIDEFDKSIKEQEEKLEIENGEAEREN